jgi:2-hydroxychromene-2-carboxylate isomerase
MQTIDWYFDFISPFSYLQFEHFHRLPDSVQIQLRPVLFAGLLNHWDNKGPAEIPAKRRFTYRYVHWLARRHGILLRMPPAHPFNPLRVLRFSIALDNRLEVVREIFRFIWREGRDPGTAADWRLLQQRLGVTDADTRIADPEVKRILRRNTEDAITLGVFGVPTFVAGGELFWGFDATDLLLDFLGHPDLFDDPEMVRISHLPSAAQRR